jgi:anti-sigma regulatory factor (Ser/Thr protein kinase)
MRREARFRADLRSVTTARRFIARSLTDVPDDAADAVALIASELASNSVRHAESPFRIRIERLPDHIRLEVEDDGGGRPMMKSPSITDTSGRGLQIVAALADDWKDRVGHDRPRRFRRRAGGGAETPAPTKGNGPATCRCALGRRPSTAVERPDLALRVIRRLELRPDAALCS